MLLLYIDPGTGSMIFSIVIGLVTMLYFLSKALWIKIKFIFTGGRSKGDHDKRYPFVIYCENKRYWNVFEPIVNEFEKRETSLVYYTSSDDDPILSKNYSFITSEYIGGGNKAYTRLNFLEADVCLMTTPGLNVYQLKRSRGVSHYSHILHAVGDATGYRLFGLDYFDSVLLNGEYQIEDVRLLEGKRGIPKKDLPVVGCPYLDVLQKKVSAEEFKKKSPFTVLVAPSWGRSGILSKYQERLLDALVETGFNTIVRPHPQSMQSERSVIEKLQKRYEGNPLVQWDFNTENLLALSQADIMISDFSSVMFDYVFLFDRPFLYLNADFDIRPYDAGSLERLPWKLRVLSEIGVELAEVDFDNLKQVIEEVSQSQLLAENRSRAKATAWQYIGLSGERAADYLIAQQKELQDIRKIEK